MQLLHELRQRKVFRVTAACVFVGWLLLNLASVPVEFVLFAATLLGVAAFHRHALAVAATGLAVITLFKLGTTGFH